MKFVGKNLKATLAIDMTEHANLEPNKKWVILSRNRFVKSVKTKIFIVLPDKALNNDTTLVKNWLPLVV